MVFFSDYVDSACKHRMGHTNWSLLTTDEIKLLQTVIGKKIEEAVVFYTEPSEEEDYGDDD